MIYGNYHEKIAKVYHNLVKINFEGKEFVTAWESYKKSLEMIKMIKGYNYEI